MLLHYVVVVVAVRALFWTHDHALATMSDSSWLDSSGRSDVSSLGESFTLPDTAGGMVGGDTSAPPARPGVPDASGAGEAVNDDAASRAGTLVRWPLANVLSYHFPMIAEAPRNVKFERALLRSIRAYQRRHNGEGPHVLDIGSGTGLLAMMAARAGAQEVHSLEMVPALAAAATHIVAHNGYADRVSIHSVMSTSLDPAAVVRSHGAQPRNGRARRRN